MRTRLKICGLTNDADARLAIGAGADALGFVFWPASPRAITPGDAASIAGDVPMIARVGVFVNASPDEVAGVVRVARLTAAQLHGEERVDRYARIGVPLIKAMSLENEADVTRALGLPNDVTVLIDAHDRTRRGGTGARANWSLARKVAEVRPILLAGGLAPENVAMAIREVRPWGVDVSSGVESQPGRKCAERLVALATAVRQAGEEDE